jgi:hypothetical protein
MSKKVVHLKTTMDLVQNTRLTSTVKYPVNSVKRNTYTTRASLITNPLESKKSLISDNKVYSDDDVEDPAEYSDDNVAPNLNK